MRVIADYESSSIIYMEHSAPFPVSNRDFVAFKCTERQEDGTIISYGHSCLHPEAPTYPKLVRGVGFSAYFLEHLGKPMPPYTNIRQIFYKLSKDSSI